MPPEIERIPAITGLGQAVGQNVVDNAQIAEILGKDPRAIIRVMRPVGVQTRNWVTKGTLTSDLCAEALSGAIEMAGIDKSELTTIIVATSSPDYIGVPVAPIVQDKLEIPGDSLRAYDVAAACPGWVHALYNSFVEMTAFPDQDGAQAVMGAEIMSPMLSKNQPLMYPLFGDAAGAVIVKRVEPDEGAPTAWKFKFGSEGSFAKSLYMPGGGSFAPASQRSIDEDLHTLRMDGAIVKEHAIAQMSRLAGEVLEELGIPIEEVDQLVPHQANLDIIQKTAESLNFPMEKVFTVIDHMGNTSAASIPTAMKEAWDMRRINRNEIVVFTTFGAGFGFAAGVMPMVGLPKR